MPGTTDSAPAPTSEPQSLGLKQRLELGTTGLRVSPCCLGLVDAPEIVSAAYHAGINFFFLSADMHWPLYENVREGLRQLLRASPNVRSEIVVAVVSYVTQPEFCEGPFEEVLAAVPELGHIDVAVIGGSYAADFAIRCERYRSNRPGRMRALGVSFHDRTLAVSAVNQALVDVAFVRYNSLHCGAEADLFPLIQEGRSSKLFNFKSMGGYVEPQRLDQLGLPAHNWRPAPTDHYRFALRVPAVDGILCALSSEEQVAALARALQPALSEPEATYMKQLSRMDLGLIELTRGP
jgi:predicted aldo/keto reductase-like oxidoreductase